MNPTAPPGIRRGGSLAVAAALVTGVAGCEVTAVVGVEVSGRGGEVKVSFRLDDEALSVFGPGADREAPAAPDGPDAGGDPIEALVAGSDVRELRRAGWSIAPPRPTSDGGVEVAFAKAFGRAGDLGRVVGPLSGRGGPLSGRGGPLSGFRLRRTRTFAGVDYRLEGTLDAGALTGLDNAAGLLERLEEAGVEGRRVTELLARRSADGFRLRFTADLPGGARSDTTRRDGRRSVWEVAGDEMVKVRVSSRTDLTRPAFVAVTVLLGAAAALMFRRPRAS